MKRGNGLTRHSSYQHLISGIKSRTLDDAKGGILADDMGLGKSLVMISTIAGSLERAHTFSVSEKNAPASGNRPIVASKATLIIAPSPCMFANT